MQQTSGVAQRLSPMGQKSCASTCQMIRGASTEAEVITAVRRYLSELDPVEVKAIPGDLLSLHIHHARDIAAAALELAKHEASISQDAPEAALVKDVATVFSTAAMRLALIALEPGREPA
jgi:hypothetical protein